VSARPSRKLYCALLCLSLGLVMLPPVPSARAEASAAPGDGFADPAIRAVWARSDAAVASGQAARAWLWGPGPFYTTYEPADGTPTGAHLVQYFDKGRLEVNDPGADRGSRWFVTAGLLVKEMVLGAISTGSAPGDTEARPPAHAPLSGDAGPGAAPSYADCRALVLAAPPGDRTGGLVDLRLGADGSITHDVPMPISLAVYDARSRHNIAAPLWRYIEAGGADAPADWVYTLGLPLAEPFWIRVRVGGAERDVLVQLFERRSLTYTPANAQPWQVEMGNVGRHYYDWRYADLRPDTKTPATRTGYDVAAHVGDDRGLDVVERIHYTNTTAARVALHEVVLRVVYHHWRGAFTVQAAHAGDQPAPTRWREEVNLAIGLPAPLAPGASVDLDLAFGLHPPTFGGRHGYDPANDLLTLGDWLPSIVPYENGGWDVFPYAEHGDQGINEVGDYRVSFTSDHPLVAGGTGTTVAHDGRHWTFDAPGVRDVAYSISPRLVSPLDDAGMARDAGGVKVLGYFMPGHRAAGGALLDTVAAALRWYSAHIGPYPYPVFTVSEMALPREAQWDYDQEYPMLYLIPTEQAAHTPQPGTWSWYTPLHETAHAWFYSAVGNNQLTDPWLDEAMATYMSAEYIRDRRPDLYPAAFAAMSGPGGGWPVSAGLYSGFPSDAAYIHAVYDQGALMLDAVRAAMGPDRFWAALRDYYATYTGRAARPRDLLVAFQRHSAVDLAPIWNRYLAAW